MDNKSNFRRGSVELLVLHLLNQKDYYGYELSQTIKEQSDSVLNIPVGSLYPALYKLIDSGYIYDYKKLKELQIIFNNCEEAKDYPDIYALCNWDSSYVVGDDAGARDYYLFDANDFEKEYKKLYGNDKILEKENFKVHSIYECSYYEKSDKYICHTLETGWATDAAEFTKLVKAEKINNQLILYDYYVWVTPDGTYKDYKETRKISDKLVTDNIWNNEEFKNEELFEQGQLYKHVFKSNGNGEYYWYSSEPVDDLED